MPFSKTEGTPFVRSENMVAVGIFVDRDKAPSEVGVEPTNADYESTAIPS